MSYKNYINERVSLRASRQFRRIVSGRTEIADLRSGSESRVALRKHKPYSYKANYALLDRPAQIELASIFHAVDAMLYLFRFRDYGDYTVVDSPLVVAVGTTTPVQLTKRYSFGLSYSDRRLQAVTKAVVKDSLGAEIAGTLDKELGFFTPAAAWPAGTITWSGRFDVWVRFASDDLDMTMETLDIATSDVELQEQVAVRIL